MWSGAEGSLQVHDIEYWIGEAQRLRRQGDLIDALDALERALALDADDVEALIEKSRALHDLGRAAEAAVTLAHADRLVPRTTTALSDYGSLLFEGGWYAEALAAFEAAATQDAEGTVALRGAGAT